MVTHLCFTALTSYMDHAPSASEAFLLRDPQQLGGVRGAASPSCDDHQPLHTKAGFGHQEIPNSMSRPASPLPKEVVDACRNINVLLNSVGESIQNIRDMLQLQLTINYSSYIYHFSTVGLSATDDGRATAGSRQ